MAARLFLPMPKPNKKLDEGINVLHAMMKPGQRLSSRSIAEIIGCSNTLVYLIEKKALKKVREKLRKEMGVNHGEFSVFKTIDF